MRKPIAAEAVPCRQAMKTFSSTTMGRSRSEANEKAQDHVYDAWERGTARSRIAPARKALAIKVVRLVKDARSAGPPG